MNGSKRGFTLIELMIACAISAFMLTSIMGILTATWLLAKSSSDEIQGSLRARAVREMLFYSLDERDGRMLGLVHATNIVSSSSELLAQFQDAAPISIRAERPADLFVSELDHTKSDAAYRDAGKVLQYVYLAVRTSRGTTFYDRMVVPSIGFHFGARQDRTVGADEIGECFGE